MRDNLEHIRRLPNAMLASLHRLIVNRVGQHTDAFMITRDIIKVLSAQQTYQLQYLPQGMPTLQPVIQQQMLTREDDRLRLPKHAVVQGAWITATTDVHTEANILGGLGMLQLQDVPMPIPVVLANHADLAFYDARLLTSGSAIRFETRQNIPLTEVSIGKHYVDHYLSQAALGGGEYIEYHDQPHFWAPQNAQAGGHILLGRQIGQNFYFTGFHIPFGCAVYLSPFALHSDAYLVGDYLVVYALCEKFSTVLFKNQHQDIQRLRFQAM